MEAAIRAYFADTDSPLESSRARLEAHITDARFEERYVIREVVLATETCVVAHADDSMMLYQVLMLI